MEVLEVSDEFGTTLLREVREFRDIVKTLTGELNQHIKGEETFWSYNNDAHRELIKNLTELSRELRELQKLETKLEHLRSDVDRHITDHRWWFGATITLVTIAAGTIGWLAGNWDAITAWMSRLKI